MPSSTSIYDQSPGSPRHRVKEGEIEYGFVGKLQDLKYEYRSDISDRAALEKNFRERFEALNRVKLTEAEFARLLDEIVTPDVYTAAKTLRGINAFTRDDGTPLNYTLVNIKDWCKNHFEVVHQLRINTDNSHHRYDVLILINGVPCVQIELKTLGVNPRRAMEQIVEYKHDPGNGYTKTLLCFMQLFIVSNRDRTYYFANNNARHFAFNADERFLPIYEFADEGNHKITQLDEFADYFLKKCDLGRTISRYMVLLAGEQKLMIMRPYQVYAVQHIVKCIDEDNGNGYIWHTTGSGKTLTSFKASTLLKENDHIHKCVFVVDRKDLDRQTREEFNKFQEGCVEENTNTAALVRRLLSEDYADKVIVTTIQKLGLALDENSKRNKQRSKNGQATYKEQLEALKDKRIVFIFDECHRSQFGENHNAIKAFFPKAQLFGFTGTPIFEANATLQKIEDTQASMRTTADLFQKQLHAYTITHAIEDGNVLRFHVDYFKPEGKKPPKPGEAIPKKAVIEAILAKHDAATGGRRFNAILATASINDAIEYHALFKTLQVDKQAADPDFRPLNVACVFSPPAEGDPDVKQIQEDLPQEQADNEEDPEGKKASLKAILADYNTRYGTNHRLSEFDLYYQDVQKRIKDQQWPNADYPAAQKIDITIVVDMLLTGFDSKFLNTLYVDKNLKHHGLIQAFSRTNRVLNGTKPYGNILDFRQQQDSVDAAIALFSGEKTSEQAREIWLVDKAPVVIQKLETAVQKLDDFMKSQGLACTPSAVANLKGDDARAAFITHFKEVQRLKTQLDQYTDLTRKVPLALWYANNVDDIPAFEKQMRRKVHYVVQPAHLWNSIANLARTQNAELLNTLQAGFKYIETESFESTFQGLFSEIDLSSPKLGKTYADRNAKLCSILQEIAKGLADFSTSVDALGDAYEYLIGQFAAGSGKKAGEFYTPQQISDILSAIVTLDSQEPKTGTKKRLESVLDFACGSGSLLLNVRKKVAKADGTIGKIFGQEKNITTYNLARMNMLLHGVKDTEFEIFHGDTLLNEWDMMREQNPAKKPTFDAIVANPPFSYRWEPTDALADDVRFKSHGLAPKSAADFAFLLHGFHYLKDEGVMAIILPHGVLFRGGAEERIRTKLLKDGHIDTVIGLPANLFYSTGIPVCILVLKKCKKPDDVLFINAAEHYDKGKRQNQLKPKHITKIIETYQFRKEEARYSRKVEMAEIEKNDFNLNISRYISTAVSAAEIDLDAAQGDLVEIEKAIAAAKAKHNEFLKELGLKLLP